jgi:hypothetical protein
MKVRDFPLMTATAATLFLGFNAHAFAEVDAQAVFDGLKRQLGAQGLEVSAVSVTAEGSNNVVISGISVGVPGEDDVFKFEGLLLEDVMEADNGAYVIGRMSAPAATMTEDGITVEFEGATVEGFYVAGPEETDPIVAAGLYRVLEIGEVEVSAAGSTMFKLDGVVSKMSAYEPGGTMEFDAEVEGFSIDFTKVPEPDVQKTMGELGYDQMSGRMTMTGSWDTSSGDMTADQVYEVDDAATLNIGLSIGGYTPELVAALQKMQADMQDQGDEAMGLAMMGLMQQLEIGGLSIEIVDRSATGRILDFVAKEQGTNREGIVAQAKGILPFALAQLQNPEFAAKVSAAVGSYLDNPGSLQIVSAPASPVPVAQIMAAGMSAPHTLIDVLAVDVAAE